MPRVSAHEHRLGRAVELVVISKLGRGHQSELARRCGVAPPAVNQSFSGKHPISEATIERYAFELGLDPLEMISTGIELLLAATGGANSQEEDEEEEIAPRSSIGAGPGVPAVGKPHRRTKAGKVKQPPHSTKAEVEAAPAPKKLQVKKNIAKPKAEPEAKPAPKRQAKR